MKHNKTIFNMLDISWSGSWNWSLIHSVSWVGVSWSRNYSDIFWSGWDGNYNNWLYNSLSWRHNKSLSWRTT